jgi:hypothetical protein
VILMTLKILAAPASGVALVRSRQTLACAVAALAIGAMAPAAHAADECGVLVNGAVTCTGTSFASGVTYNAATPSTITAAAGAGVTTTTDNTNGVTILGTGATTLAGAGNVSTSGLNSTGVAVFSAQGPVAVNTGQVTVTGTGGNAIFAVSGGPVTVSTAGASSVDLPAIFAHSGNSTATVAVNGGTVRSSLSDGIDIASATGSTVVNNGTVIGGRYAIIDTGTGATVVNNNGTLTGALSLGDNAAVNNVGTFNAVGDSTFGPGSQFNNTGTVTVGAGSATPASVSLSGGTFNNGGLIDLRNGRVGDVLTINGNYVGAGNAAVALEAAQGAAVANDSIVVNGSATGRTLVTVTQGPGSTPVFNSGTVFVTGGAGSTAGAFVVAPNSVNAGLVRYDVAYNGATGTYSLVASPGDAANNTMRYGTIERNLWNKSADAVSAHLQQRRDALWAQGDGGATGKFWMSIAGNVDRTRNIRDFSGVGRNTDTGYSQTSVGGQVGMDISGGVGERGGFSFGVTGGYINSVANFRSGPDSLNTNAVNGGAYVSFTSGNVFINGLAKYDYYWMDVDSGLGGYSRGLHGHAWGARGEVGMRLGGDRFFVEPLGQLSWVNSTLNRFSVQGTTVDFNDRDQFRVKAGGRVGGVMPLGDGPTRMSYYLGASYVHDFRREATVTFSNAGGTVNRAGYKTPDAIEGVLGWNIASNRAVSGFMEGTYTRSFHGDDVTGQRTEGFGGRAGVNVRF